MVENSLGRLWLESRPNDELKANWKYYLDEAEQTPEVAEKLHVLRSQSPVKSPEDIRLIDPCMGSGHILVYAFDVLMQIYESEGYNPRDAAKLILEKNIYGLDIDRRAYQLAYFSLMMKARQYNRRIFTEDIKPQVYHPVGYPDGEEYGSLVKVDELKDKPRIKGIGEQIEFDDNYERDMRVWNFKRLLAQKYDVVVTNPPYMGAGGMNSKMTEFVKDYYPDSKSDASTAFMEQALNMCSDLGYMAMINIPVWMFIASYEKLRGKIIRNNTIVNMVHFGRGIFGSDFGTTSFVIAKSNVKGFKGVYRKLFEKQGAVDSVEQKQEWFFAGKGKFTARQNDFLRIPATPIAYWVSDAMLQAFEKGMPFGDVASPRQGMATSDNNRFLRLWYEVEYPKVGLDYPNVKQAEMSGRRWFPYNKGGAFRKWYGNNDFLVDWANDGYEIKQLAADLYKSYTRTIKNIPYYFRESITWTLISSASNCL